MRKGEIYLVDLTGKGHQQRGFGPVIICSKKIGNLVSVVPMTSNLDAMRYGATCKIDKSDLNKLEMASVALVFQLRSINFRDFVSKVGELDVEDLKLIDDKIKEFLILK